jgi:hypothetical protein
MPNAWARFAISCPMLLRIFLLVPGAGAQLGDVVGHAAIERQHQREGELGDGDRVLAGAVRHVDAAPRRRRDIDRVVAGAGADDQRERAGFEHRRRHRRAANDEHVRRGLAQRGRQRVVFEIGLVNDLTAGGFQAVDPALLELVRDQYLHSTVTSPRWTRTTPRYTKLICLLCDPVCPVCPVWFI